MRLRHLAVITSTLVAIAVGCPKVNYSELQALGAACSPADTCSVSRPTNLDLIGLYRCQCRATCIKSNTCCIDSHFVSFAAIQSKHKRGGCQKIFGSSQAVLMVSKCERHWRGDQMIKDMCETSFQNLRDPLSITPVTNRNSETTYKNYWCAACNHDLQFLELWDIKVTALQPRLSRNLRDVPEDELMQELTFDNQMNSWGFKESNGQFLPVGLSFSAPERISNILTTCVADAVSDCASSWADYKIRNKCLAYMGLVYIPASDGSVGPVVAYRNIHCAICNFQNYSTETICASPGLSLAPAPAARPPMSFTLLLDVNLSDGNEVGKVDLCGKGQIYDPFFKRCRTLVCALPGYVIKDGKCSPP